MSHDYDIHKGKGAETSVKGTVTDVFAHRFVLQQENGKILADIGKHNRHAITINVGDRVEITGEKKPSEVKARMLRVNGKDVILESKKKHDFDNHDPKNRNKRKSEIILGDGAEDEDTADDGVLPL